MAAGAAAVAGLAAEAGLVAAGAGAGAVCRFAAHEAYVRWHARRPWLAGHPPLWGIVAVNAVASAVLGAAAADASASRRTGLLVGTGFCGGMSTFSTFALEAAKLAAAQPRLCALYVIVSNVGCIAAAGCAFAWRRARIAKALSVPGPTSGLR